MSGCAQGKTEITTTCYLSKRKYCLNLTNLIAVDTIDGSTFTKHKIFRQTRAGFECSKLVKPSPKFKCRGKRKYVCFKCF